MNRQLIVLFRGGIMAVLVLSLCGGTALAQQDPGVQKAAKNQPKAAPSAFTVPVSFTVRDARCTLLTLRS